MFPASFLTLALALFSLGCDTSEDTKEAELPKRQKGRFAFIGSYSSSSALPPPELLEEFSQNESSLFYSSFLSNIDAADKVADVVKGQRVESIFTTGDNNYSYGCQDDIDINIGRLYHEYIGNYQGSYGEGADTNEFFPTLGNHDVLIYEAYLIKNDLPIVLNGGSEGDNYRFSRVDWIWQIENFLFISSTSAEAIFDHLLGQSLFEEKSVQTMIPGSTDPQSSGTSYIPKQRITLDHLTDEQKTELDESFEDLFGTSNISRAYASK